MNIRSAKPADVPRLLQLYRHLDPDDKQTTIEDGVRNLEMLGRFPGSQVLIGCIGEEVVASCTLVVVPNLTRGGAPYGLIENVVTDSAYRGRGYGKAVLKAAAEAAWQAGCYKVMLLTGSKRPEVLKFYQDTGFEQNKTGFQMRKLPVRGE